MNKKGVNIFNKSKITISGLGGVGKGTVAKLLSEKLNFKYLSGGDFFRNMAEELNLSLYDFDQFVKKNPEYDLKLDQMQEKYGQKNENFVLESRLGWHFIPDSFKIRLDCDNEVRYKRILGRDGSTVKEIKTNEKERFNAIVERYKALYKLEDFLNENNFNYIIDSTNLTPEEVVENILKEYFKLINKNTWIK